MAATSKGNQLRCRRDLIEESKSVLDRVVVDREDRYPQRLDEVGEFSRKRTAILDKIVPMSIVPLATSNAMLTMGSQKRTGPNGDCFFPLPQFLIWAGAVSLSLVTFGVMSRHVLNWILRDRACSPGEQTIINLLEYLATFVAAVQAFMLLSGSAILFPNMGYADLDDRESEYYCDRGLVVFSAIFLSMSWLFVAVALFCLIYVHCTTGDIRGAVKAKVMAECISMYGYIPTSTNDSSAGYHSHSMQSEISSCPQNHLNDLENIGCKEPA